MAQQISTLTAALKRIFQDATTAQAEHALNLAHEDFVLAVPGAARTKEEISVTAGTRNYALQAGVVEVMEVYWVTSATASKRLSHRPLEQIPATADAQARGYPVLASGTPASYHVQGDATSVKGGDLQIVLTPPPDATTSGSYPKLHVYETVVKTLATADFIPEGPAMSRFYRHRAAMYLAEELRPERVSEFKALSDEALPVCIEFWRKIVPSTDKEAKIPLRKP